MNSLTRALLLLIAAGVMGFFVLVLSPDEASAVVELL